MRVNTTTFSQTLSRTLAAGKAIDVMKSTVISYINRRAREMKQLLLPLTFASLMMLSSASAHGVSEIVLNEATNMLNKLSTIMGQDQTQPTWLYLGGSTQKGDLGALPPPYILWDLLIILLHSVSDSIGFNFQRQFLKAPVQMIIAFDKVEVVAGIVRDSFVQQLERLKGVSVILLFIVGAGQRPEKSFAVGISFSHLATSRDNRVVLFSVQPDPDQRTASRFS